MSANRCATKYEEYLSSFFFQVNTCSLLISAFIGQLLLLIFLDLSEAKLSQAFAVRICPDGTYQSILLSVLMLFAVVILEKV